MFASFCVSWRVNSRVYRGCAHSSFGWHRKAPYACPPLCRMQVGRASGVAVGSMGAGSELATAVAACHIDGLADSLLALATSQQWKALSGVHPACTIAL